MIMKIGITALGITLCAVPAIILRTNQIERDDGSTH
jgi:hypothetical protein